MTAATKPGGVCMLHEQESENQAQEDACQADKATSPREAVGTFDATLCVPERALGNGSETRAPSRAST
jgi:hypothetical protein